MTLQGINPKELVKPKTAYSQVVHLSNFSDLVIVSGQVGVDADGRMASGFGSQVRAALANLTNALKATGMDVSNIVRMGHYVNAGEDLEVFNRERELFIGDHRPASSLIFVHGPAHPQGLYEVDCIAAR